MLHVYITVGAHIQHQAAVPSYQFRTRQEYCPPALCFLNIMLLKLTPSIKEDYNQPQY